MSSRSKKILELALAQTSADKADQLLLSKGNVAKNDDHRLNMPVENLNSENVVVLDAGILNNLPIEIQEDLIYNGSSIIAELNSTDVEAKSVDLEGAVVIASGQTHYCRMSSDRDLLNSDTTLNVMYDMYKSEVTEPMSYAFYKNIFYTKFNLKRKPLKKDTCNLCDKLNAQKQCSSDFEEVDQKHVFHLNQAKFAQDLMKQDLNEAKNSSGKLEVLTFDMQKTLPLPRIPTNVVFYKRQLWLYNCGVHCGSSSKRFCYIWLEGEAGRGAQEVGSCIKKHIENEVSETVEEMIFWSDSCGGQNRNIKLTMILKTVLEAHPTLKKIKLRFLISGHSYLPNDAEFGDIECALKLQQRLYAPEDYIKIMLGCRKKNKLSVTRMQNSDFYGTKGIEKGITNRKKDVDNTAINWLTTREIIIRKDDPFSIYLSKAFNGDSQKIDIKKRTRIRGRAILENSSVFNPLQPLWPEGKPISSAKLADMKSLIHLIPADVKGFYENLTEDKELEDDVDGFNGSLDFEVEDESII